MLDAYIFNTSGIFSEDFLDAKTRVLLQVGECLVPLVMTQCADAQIVSILEVIESAVCRREFQWISWDFSLSDNEIETWDFNGILMGLKHGISTGF